MKARNKALITNYIYTQLKTTLISHYDEDVPVPVTELDYMVLPFLDSILSDKDISEHYILEIVKLLKGVQPNDFNHWKYLIIAFQEIQKKAVKKTTTTMRTVARKNKEQASAPLS